MFPGNSDAVGWGGAWEFPLKKISPGDYDAHQHWASLYTCSSSSSQMFNHPQKNHPHPQSPARHIADKSNWGVIREYKFTLILF